MVEVNAADLRAVVWASCSEDFKRRTWTLTGLDHAILDRLRAALPVPEWEPDEEVVRNMLGVRDWDERGVREILGHLHDAGLDVVLREGES